jgi:phosphopantothenoylcysteine decarboxylase
MARVLLGVTGSVASILTPQLYAGLRAAGHTVKVVATDASLYFFDPGTLEGGSGAPRNPEVVIVDADEWPGRAAGRRYQRGDPVLHIELRRWAQALVLAPLDAHTLAKLALGLCDNCLTCLWRAWEPGRPVVLAPAMNTLMWEHPATARHLRQLAEDVGAGPAPAELPLPALIAWLNRQAPWLRLVPPQSKRLACNDIGLGALAPVEEIIATLEQLLAACLPSD